MINPVRDTWIAFALTLAGLAGVALGLPRLLASGGEDVPGSFATVIGGMVALFGALLTVNFYWSLRIMRRMQRGDGVIARWLVPAAVIDSYLAREAATPPGNRSRWQPNSGTAAEVFFSADGVLAGNRYHALSASGLQTFVSARRVSGTPDLLEFATRELRAVGDRLRRDAGVLRLPIPPGAEAEAERALAHYGQILAGEIQAKPKFWSRRIRYGIVAFIIGSVLGAMGWVTADQYDWRADTDAGSAGVIMAVVGGMIAIVGAVVAVVAAAFNRHERRGRR